MKQKYTWISSSYIFAVATPTYQCKETMLIVVSLPIFEFPFKLFLNVYSDYYSKSPTVGSVYSKLPLQ